jgi:murein L,D-transpeptidase YcbB/YkuD
MLRMDVIVGKTFPLTQTPVFAADMRYVVLHPYWDVPYSIVKRELLPLIQRDPGYIARNDYEIVRGQTDAAEVQPVNRETLEALARGTLRLRQKPGPKNPLGFVKFMLPNAYNVYLHATSAPALFGGAQRAFSHGCVRVADPTGLLSYVLRDNPEYDQERIQELLQEPGPHRINLRTSIRVYIVYTTALAAEDGRTLFFKNIYRHDGRCRHCSTRTRSGWPLLGRPQ